MSSAFAASQEGSTISWRRPFGFARVIMDRTPVIQDTVFFLAEAAEAENSPKRIPNPRKKWELVNSTSRGTESTTYDSLAVSQVGFQAAGQKQQATSKTSRQSKSGVVELKTADR